MRVDTFSIYCALSLLNILTPEMPHISANQMCSAVDMVGFVRIICAVCILQYIEMYLHLAKTHYC